MDDRLLEALFFFGTPEGVLAVAAVLWLMDLLLNDDHPGGPGYGG